jgi:hypothetical protein
MKTTNWILSIFAAALISACGGGSSGGGGSSSPSATTVDGSNKTAVAKTATIGSEQAIESSSAPRALNSDSLSYLLMKDTVTFLKRSNMARNTVDLSSSVCPDGGSASYETSGQTSQSGSFTIIYNNCAYSYGSETTVVDGTATWIVNDDGSFSYEYDLTTTYGGESTTLTATYSCDAEYNCSYEDSFVSGGTSYKISNASVSGNSSSGYNVTVRVTNENYGYVDIEATGLVPCSGGGFSSGSIDVTDSSGSSVLEVTFVSCSEMTVTFEGVAETVSQ